MGRPPGHSDRQPSERMSPIIQAAVLGVIQGVTEFLPVSSTAHLLIGERLIGYQDPGGVFTVMIQLGSIFAVMWLYRAKIGAVVTGLPSRPEARHFAVMILVATVPALVAGGLFSKFVKNVLYGNFVVIATAFILGGIINPDRRAVPPGGGRARRGQPASRTRAGHWILSGAGAHSRRLAIGRDDRCGQWRCAWTARRRPSSPSSWRCRR